MEEATEVAEVGTLVVGMTRSVVREVGGTMRVGFMVVEPIVIDDISSRKLYTRNPFDLCVWVVNVLLFLWDQCYNIGT